MMLESRSRALRIVAITEARAAACHVEDPLTRLATLATLSPIGGEGWGLNAPALDPLEIRVGIPVAKPRLLGHGVGTEIPVANPRPLGGEGARGTRAGEGVRTSLDFATFTEFCG